MFIGRAWNWLGQEGREGWEERTPETPRVQGFGFRVSGLRFRVSGLGFQISGFRLRVQAWFGIAGFEYPLSAETFEPFARCNENY